MHQARYLHFMTCITHTCQSDLHALPDMCLVGFEMLLMIGVGVASPLNSESILSPTRQLKTSNHSYHNNVRRRLASHQSIRVAQEGVRIPCSSSSLYYQLHISLSHTGKRIEMAPRAAAGQSTIAQGRATGMSGFAGCRRTWDHVGDIFAAL